MPNPDALDQLDRELSKTLTQQNQNQSDEIESFVPRRMRADRQVAARPEPPQAAEPVDLLARNAAAVYDGVREIQDKERRAREALNVAEARLEQLQAYNQQLQLDLHNTKTELDRERTERIRLATIIENVGGLVQDGLANRKVDDPA